MSFKDKIFWAVAGLCLALLSIPIAFVGTILLVPFWSWLEASTGIESLGHSGPAEWCYLLVFLFVVSLIGLGWSLQGKKKKSDLASK